LTGKTQEVTHRPSSIDVIIPCFVVFELEDSCLSVLASFTLLIDVAGEAGGTIDGELWRTPAAWKAVICDGSVVEWRAFADNKPVYEILERR
jgi:hypothetical protein